MLDVLHPASWPRPKGYSSAMMGTGTFVLLSGQVGWDEKGVFAEGMVPQIAQALDQRAGEVGARLCVHSGAGHAVHHQRQKHQHLAHKAEVQRPHGNTKAGIAQLRDHIARHPPDDEGQHAGRLTRRLGCATLKPLAFDPQGHGNI